MTPARWRTANGDSRDKSPARFLSFNVLDGLSPAFYCRSENLFFRHNFSAGDPGSEGGRSRTPTPVPDRLSGIQWQRVAVDGRYIVRIATQIGSYISRA